MNSGSKELLDKVKSWVEKEGFPLEMRLRKAFTDNQFSFVQAAYNDPETSKYRAGADLAVHKSAVVPVTGGGQYRVYSFAIVECKSGNKKPWVIFMQPHQGAGINLVQQLTTTEEDRRLVELATHPKYRQELEPQLMKNKMLISPPHVGYAVSEYDEKKGNSPPYNAIRQVIDGSIGVTQEHKNYYSNPKHKNITLFAATNFIVTKAPIFTCSLCSDGSEAVEETDNVMYVDFRGQGQAQRMHYIRIVTEEYLMSKLDALGQDMQILSDTLVKVLADNHGKLM